MYPLARRESREDVASENEQDREVSHRLTLQLVDRANLENENETERIKILSVERHGSKGQRESKFSLSKIHPTTTFGRTAEE